MTGWAHRFATALVGKARAAIFGASRPSGRPSTCAENWEWWSGNNDELYQLGPFGSREEALADARDYFDPGETIYLIEAVPAEWRAPDATTVIENMFENSEDLFSDDYPDPCGTADESKRAEQELQRALNAWMNKWRTVIFPPPTQFGKTRCCEVIPTPEASAIETRSEQSA